MSTIKTKKVQVGTDSTASNNFTIYTPGTPDGTVRIGNGNADSPTEIARFDANGLIMASGKSVSGNPPQVTVYTSGTGTYTTPTNASYLVIEMVGGGSGGSGGGLGGGAGTGGGTTTFGGSLSCTGGIAAGAPVGGVGGNGTGGDVNIEGGDGHQGFDGRTTTQYSPGGTGGASYFGGGGKGGYVATGDAGSAYGSGGGGGGISAANFTGAGGGAGGYLRKTITSPSASYSYAVGAGGNGGTAGTNGLNGGAGKSGVIMITAYFG